MPAFIDLSDKTFGEWTVLSQAESRNSFVHWLCRCSCGREVSVNGSSLRRGLSTCCLNCSCRKHGENLIGQQIGNWTVMKFAGINKHRATQYLCRCICGTVKIIYAANLRSGTSTQCKDCSWLTQRQQIHHIPPVTKGLVGQTFRNWTVLSRVRNSKSGKSRWNCRCSCGHCSIIRSSHLRNGSSTSCRRCARTETLAGKTFGNWTVLNKAEKSKHGQQNWLCHCSCGTEKVVLANSLRSGISCSCGCSRIGINNRNYNHNKTDEERKIDRSYPGYVAWRKSVYKRDEYTCQVCGAIGGKLVVHHLACCANNPSLRTESTNAITLCKNHHKEFHKIYGYKNNTKEQYDDWIVLIKEKR